MEFADFKLKENDENVLSKFKATGQQRVFVLAEASGVPENRTNVEILLNSLRDRMEMPQVLFVFPSEKWRGGD